MRDARAIDADFGGDKQPKRERGRPRGTGACCGKILDAALEVFTELGYERATLQDIVERAGVSKGALYHYFDSKDQLFVDLVRECLGALATAGEARIAAADPALSREALLRQHLEEIWSTLQQPHMLELSQLVMTELPKFPEIGKAFFDEVVTPARRTMRRIWEWEGAGAELHGDHIEALIAALPSMLLGVALTQRVFAAIDPLRPDPERLGRTIIDALLHGALEAGAAAEAREQGRARSRSDE
ncbi:MAG: TetR/AcrR family transcriptional regulator [Gemmatimonadota bacterium]